MGNPWGERSESRACVQFYTGCFGGSSLIERCFCGDERVLDSSELLTYFLALVLRAGVLGGVTGQEGARKLDLKRRKCHSPGSLAGAQSCWCCIQGDKASLCLMSPAQPSPESRLGTAPDRLLRAQNTRSASTVQVAAASWGPAGPRISARALLRAEGRGVALVPLESGAGFSFPRQPQLGAQASCLICLSSLDLSLPLC